MNTILFLIALILSNVMAVIVYVQGQIIKSLNKTIETKCEFREPTYPLNTSKKTESVLTD